MGGMTVVCEGCGVRLYMKTLSSILTFVSQVHRKYTAADFDDDLRTVLRRSGCRDEKIVFIMDESNVLESGFLERMNTLLANGEVCSLCYCFKLSNVWYTPDTQTCVHPTVPYDSRETSR